MPVRCYGRSSNLAENFCNLYTRSYIHCPYQISVIYTLDRIYTVHIKFIKFITKNKYQIHNTVHIKFIKIHNKEKISNLYTVHIYKYQICTLSIYTNFEHCPYIQISNLYIYKFWALSIYTNTKFIQICTLSIYTNIKFVHCPYIQRTNILKYTNRAQNHSTR